MLVKDTDFERLDGYHTLRHSFSSILVAQRKTWDQIAAFVGHVDQRTTQRYIHFMPKDMGKTLDGCGLARHNCYSKAQNHPTGKGGGDDETWQELVASTTASHRR